MKRWFVIVVLLLAPLIGGGVAFWLDSQPARPGPIIPDAPAPAPQASTRSKITEEQMQAYLEEQRSQAEQFQSDLDDTIRRANERLIQLEKSSTKPATSVPATSAGE